MPRESETYRPTLQELRERAEKVCPGKMLYTAGEIANIIGCSARTVQRRKKEYNFDRHGQTTLEKVARAISA